MSTIYRLVAELAADPAPMEAGFARGLASAKRFAESIAPTIAGIGTKTGTSEGDRIARNIITSLDTTLKREKGTIAEAFSRGSLSPAEFEKLGKQAGDGFNTGILNTISTLNAKGMLSAKARANLQGALIPAQAAPAVAAAVAAVPPLPPLPPLIPPKAEQDARNSISRIGSELRSLGKDFTQIGFEASIIFTAPLVKGASEAIDAAEELSHAVDSIGVSTGATGARLESLRGSFDHLFADLPNSAGDIATAISRIAQSSGAVGPALDDIATKTLNLSRITGTDLSANVEDTQRAFQAWGTSLADQSRDLDTLFRVSQATGAGMSTLSDSLGHFAPALRQFGLNFGQSAALIGQFQKNGIDADAVLTTLQTSLSRFAEKGIDGSHALQLLVDNVKAAGSDAEAVNLASRIFGPRQAAQLAEAIRGGSLDFQKLADQVAASGNTINKTAANTDVYGQALGRLRHEATLSGSAIGETLERSFVTLEPVLTSVVAGAGDIARAFGSLPAPLTTTATVVLGTTAAIGPLTLALGGVTRAAGAAALALGVLKGAEVEASAADLTRSMIEGSTALGGAATNAGLFARSLGLVKGGLIGLTITTVVGAIGAMTRESREAKEKLDEFRTSLKGLSQEQLTVKTTELQRDLDARMAQVAALETRITQLRAAGNTPFSGLDQNAASDSISALRGQQSDILHGNKAVVDSLVAVGQAFGKVSDQTDSAAGAAAAFQDSIAKVIETTGKGITVDASGHVAGSLTHLRELAKKLNDELSSRVEIKGFDPTVAAQALQHVENAITELQNKSAPGLASIFDQLSPSVANLERNVTTLVSRAQSLGGPLQQLSDVRLSEGLLSDLADVDRRLAALGDSSSLDAEKLRALQKQLRDTFAAQITQNPTGSGAFSLNITGKIDRIDVPSDAGEKLLAVVQPGLERVRQAAEAAAAAQLSLDSANATGTLRDIELAGVAASVAFQRARLAENAFAQSVAATGAPLQNQRAALAAMLDEVSKSGAPQDKLKIAIGLDPEDVAFIANDVHELLAKLPPQQLGLKLFVDSLSIDDLERRVSGALERAQIQGLAGDRIGAALTQNSAIDSLARQFHDLAQTMDLSDPSAADRDEFQRIQASAGRLGVSLEDLIQHYHGLTAVGKTVRLADAFAEATSAAFGTNSAIAKLTEGLDQGVKSAIDLANAIKGIGSGGESGFSSIISGITSLGSIVGAIGSIGSVIGGLLGPSKLSIEHDQILRDNNSALRDLKNSLDRQAGTAGRLDDLARAFGETTTQRFRDLETLSERTKGFSVTDPNRPEMDALTTILGDFGLTMDQAVAAAKGLNITLLDSAGHLIPSAVAQFTDAMAIQTKIITTLGTDLSSIQKRMSVDNAIAGGGPRTPAQTLKDQIDATAQVLDAQGGKLGASLEAAFADGPAAIRAKLRDLADLIEEGKIQLSDLGDFANASDFLDAIGTTADDLNALSDAANSVSDSLQNVPTGFKKALREFQAQLPQQSPLIPPAPLTPPAPPPTDTTPTRGPDSTSIRDLADRLSSLFGVPNATDLTPTHGLDTFTASLSKPIDSLGKLGISASDVADALDRLLRGSASSFAPAQSDNAIVGSRRVPAPVRQVASGSDVHLHNVTINVDARDKPVSVIFDAIKAEAHKRARQLTGDSTRVVDAFQRG